MIVPLGESRPSEPNPNVFDTVRYGSRPELTLSQEEQAILWRSADAYQSFAEDVEALRPAYRRHLEGRSEDEDPELLGDGLDSIAYPLSKDGVSYVVRFNQLPSTLVSGAMEMRLRNLARSIAFNIPHFERLVAHSLHPDYEAIITYEAPGNDQLNPNQIKAVPGWVLASLCTTAERMEQAGLCLDVSWNESEAFGLEPFFLLVSKYSDDVGPTYYDVIEQENEWPTDEAGIIQFNKRRRVSEAGRNYGELITAMIANGRYVDPDTRLAGDEGFSLEEVTSRLVLIDRAYRIMRERWPGSTGLQFLEHTSRLLAKNLTEREFGKFKRAAGKTLAVPYDPNVAL